MSSNLSKEDSAKIDCIKRIACVTQFDVRRRRTKMLNSFRDKNEGVVGRGEERPVCHPDLS